MTRNIVIVGDVIHDYTTTVDVRGVSPEDDTVLVVDRVSDSTSVGGAGNVALTCKALGTTTHVIGFNSINPLHDKLVKAGVHCMFEKPEHGKTPMKQRLVTETGRMVLRLDTEQYWGKGEAFWKGGGTLQHYFRNLALVDGLKPITGIVNYDKGSIFPEATESILATLGLIDDRFAMPLVVDPGRHGHWREFGTSNTVFKANVKQAQQFHELECKNKQQYAPSMFSWNIRHSKGACSMVIESVRKTLQDAGIPFLAVIITFGPSGIAICGRESHQFHYESVPEVPGADVCGAGDTVMATIMAHLADEELPRSWASLVEATQHAALAATIAVKHRGVYVVTAEDMQWRNPLI